MKVKIIADSSSNLTPAYVNEENITLSIAPLTILVGEESFRDDGSVTPERFMEVIRTTKAKTKSSCPSPADYLREMKDADYYILITISSKLSGSYNSANVARMNCDFTDRVFVIDSMLTAGSMELLIDEAVRLIKEGKSFEEIQKELNAYRDQMKLVFCLSHYDTLIRNGRMNMIIGTIIQKLRIKAVCIGQEGEIKVKNKVRTKDAVTEKMLEEMKENRDSSFDKKIVISHTCNLEGAMQLKEKIQEIFTKAKIFIRENALLCSYYAEQNGIIVCY